MPMGTGVRPGFEPAELLGAVLGHPRADGVDPDPTLEGEGGRPDEAFDAAVRDGEADRLGDGVLEDVAG